MPTIREGHRLSLARTARATASSSICRSPRTFPRSTSKRVSTAGLHRSAGAARQHWPTTLARAARYSSAAASTSRCRRSRAATSRRWRIAKLLSVSPRVIFLDEPTRGVDVGAKARDPPHPARPRRRRAWASSSISSELPELIGLCDRVLVRARGPDHRRGGGRRDDRGERSCGLPRGFAESRAHTQRECGHERDAASHATGATAADAAAALHRPARSSACARPGCWSIIALLFVVMSFASPYFLTWDNCGRCRWPSRSRASSSSA